MHSLGRQDRPYTTQTLAEFIGWVVVKSQQPEDRLKHSLRALQFIEKGILTEAHFKGLSPKKAEGVVEETSKTKKWHEAGARVYRREAAYGSVLATRNPPVTRPEPAAAG